MKKVVITGGTGKLGHFVVRHFVAEGYEVVHVDKVQPAEPNGARFMYADLTNLGECYGILEGADALVHLAAIPVAYRFTNEVTFQNNVMATYNLLEAAAGLDIRKVVIASSESSYGICFAKSRQIPKYVPIDEEHPRTPEDSYALSKIVNEQTADMIHARTGMQIVSMRLGNVIVPDQYVDEFPGFIHDPANRERILWSYIDARDAATACQLAIEKDGLGCVALNIGADNTSMDMTNGELLTARFPEVSDVRVPLDGYEPLLNNKKAKKVLGWQPVHNWRDHVKY